LWSLWESSLTLSDGPKALFLFDIDGTLISPGKTARNIFIEIVRELTSREVTLEVHQVAGFTDPKILENMLQRAGLIDNEIPPAMEKFFPIYYERLENRPAQNPACLNMRLSLYLFREHLVLQLLLDLKTSVLTQ